MDLSNYQIIIPPEDFHEILSEDKVRETLKLLIPGLFKVIMCISGYIYPVIVHIDPISRMIFIEKFEKGGETTATQHILNPL